MNLFDETPHGCEAISVIPHDVFQQALRLIRLEHERCPYVLDHILECQFLRMLQIHCCSESSHAAANRETLEPLEAYVFQGAEHDFRIKKVIWLNIGHHPLLRLRLLYTFNE